MCVLERDMYVEKEIDSERKKHEHDTKRINKKNRLEEKKRETGMIIGNIWG